MKTGFDQTLKFFKSFTISDIIGFIIFLLIPLGLFATDFISQYRIYFYSLLAVFVAIYTLVGQFFFEDKTTGKIGKKFLSLTVINTLIISFINFTGNITSPYFFILYFLIFTVSIFTSVEMLLFECLIIFLSILVSETFKYDSITILLQSISSQELSNLLSIVASLPLAIVISSFTRSLQRKQELLLLSRKLLMIRDIEDEVLLEEINQGIIVLDQELTIVKISRWIENKFNLTAKLILDKKITELTFFDPVSNRRLLPSDNFYKNLLTTTPNELNWRILYKNQYGKFIKFVIKQTPLLVNNNKPIGFLLLVKEPPKTVQDLVSSFNQVLSFRLSSSIAMVKNLLSISKNIKSDPIYPQVEKHLNFIVQLLNDTTTKNDIADGNVEVKVTKCDLKTVTQCVLEELDPIRKVAVWNISPLYKTKPIQITSDIMLCKKLLKYSIKGALYFSADATVNLAFDEDENLKRPRIIITVSSMAKIPKGVNILEPFFAGELVTFPKYAGTGLEFSNANLLASYLGFDFNAEIRNNSLVVKIIF
ncbi:hypothetical protein JW766_06315 [Candidatus Dojkabacteria bacterium]|nr:hypothetical protein [Candidatus Dojkabacteria bacterium]